MRRDVVYNHAQAVHLASAKYQEVQTMATDILAETLASGGGTFDANLDVVHPATGYAVGASRGTAGLAALAEQVEPMARRVLREFDAKYVGTWLTEDGVIAIDPVAIIETPEIAMKLARQNHQLAIYSFATREVIEVVYEFTPSKCECGNSMTVEDSPPRCKQCRLEGVR